MSSQPEIAPIIFVIDGEASAEEPLSALVSSAGWRAERFASARAFLRRPRVSVPACLVLDILLPDVSGLDLQKHMARDWPDLSILFVASHVDVMTAVRAMKAGAVDVLTGPARGSALLSALGEAIERSRKAVMREAKLVALELDYASLSTREREVMALVASGLLNKQVGGELGISEITVKAHRGQAMRKMKARSFAELIDMAAELGLTARSKNGRSDDRLIRLKEQGLAVAPPPPGKKMNFKREASQAA